MTVDLKCAVQRTHHRGERRRDNDPGRIAVGMVRMYSIMHPELKRYVSVMTMKPLHGYDTGPEVAIPDLLEPELLTFGSDRGMMICGFEEIDGQRYYQGWWMQWVAAKA